MTRTPTCRDGVQFLMDYTEGRLPAGRRHALETHVGDCRRCQRFLVSYCATPEILRRATATPLPAPLGRRLRRIVSSLPRRR